jgi:8-oxo-dGTP pyrophosphatase MutT (NUDIX family)
LASRGSFPLHATAGALLLRGDVEVLLVAHRGYGIWLQPGGHTEPEDDDLPAAALRELVEETGIDPAQIVCASPAPVYVECGLVPARPARGEPAHWHLDFGYLFTTGDATSIGQVQDAEVTGAAWYPLDQAARLVGPRVLRAADPDALITGGSPRV